jgi:hypothetical protein
VAEHDGRYGVCAKSDNGHDQKVTDPAIAPCIFCGLLTIYDENADDASGKVLRLHEIVIEEEPV